MNEELEAIKKALEAGAFGTARRWAAKYVCDHPNEFAPTEDLMQWYTKGAKSKCDHAVIETDMQTNRKTCLVCGASK